MKFFSTEAARRAAFTGVAVLIAGFLIWRGNTLPPNFSGDPTAAVMMILTGAMVLITGLAAALRGPEERA